MVEPGQIIIAGGKRYRVREIWPAGASKVIDFVADRTEQMGVDIEGGNPVYAGRGFSYAVKNWELEEKEMTNKEKLVLLNTIEVLDSSASAGELECVYIKLSQQNIDMLVRIGATPSEIYEVSDPSDETIDIAGIGFKYTDAQWFEEKLGGFLENQPQEAEELPCQS